MARFSAVIIMILMTSASATCADGEEGCPVEGSSMISKNTEVHKQDVPPMGRAARRIAREHAQQVKLVQSRQSAAAALNAQQAKTPPAPAPAAVESGDLPAVPESVETAMASGVMPAEQSIVPNLDNGPSTPEELMALSNNMVEGQDSENQNMENMRMAQKKARAMSIAHDRQSGAADDAEVAAVNAGDAHTRAEDMSKQAAETRHKANTAIAAMTQSKAAFGKKQELEHQARQFMGDQRKIEKRLQVKFEAAQLKSQRAQENTVTSDEEATMASMTYRKQEDALVKREKELSEAKETLARDTADQAEKESMFMYADEKRTEINAKYLASVKEEQISNTDLANKQGEDALAEVQFEKATAARDFAMNDYNFKQRENNEAEQTATELIARAHAESQTAEALGATAKEDADHMAALP